MNDLVYSRADMTWLPRDEYERRRMDREERAWRREASQGELCAPMVITDGIPLLQSMATGRWHDSKSALRREYRRHGMVEVGNDSSLTSGKRKAEPSFAERAAERERIKAAAGKALSAVETMSDDTVKRRRFEREQATAAAVATLPK